MGRLKRVDDVVNEAAHRLGIDPSLIHAVIYVESGYDNYAVSRKGAKGLMQLMPKTQQELGIRNAFDPSENVYGGTRYLVTLVRRYDSVFSLDGFLTLFSPS